MLFEDNRIFGTGVVYLQCKSEPEIPQLINLPIFDLVLESFELSAQPKQLLL